MNFKLLLVSALLFLGGCLFDPRALFGAGSPDKRFEASEKLTPPLAPPVLDTADFTFLVITDAHYGRNDSSLIKAETFRQSTPYEFLIVDGDVTQTGSTEEWEGFEQERALLGVPLYLTIGNHDLFNEGQENFYSYFGPTHYSFEIGTVLFTFFDTGNGVVSQKAKAWYTNLLLNTSTTTKLAFTHYSYLSQNVQKLVTLPNPEEFYWIANENATFGVDAMISGHLHTNLKRTIRGVDYYTLTNMGDEELPQGLLVRYQSGALSFEQVRLE